ncbi:MAG: 2-keto-3-deoxygluconate kinase [Alphaproteobacteria bacterium HGW-Alphaproteobacteria-13]|jgi:2-dehydro-3-deoxygluconokinase|nr:MAG: 2-keto-3-deoxygluconate kinase [Alphaproteobacteria bacterium HGW-Alphaproteobacteria-13]
MADTIVCFGEVLLRLSAPGRETLLQSTSLDARFGGAEANVAVALARLGERARMAGVLPDNAIGRAARDELRRHGVDVSGLGWADGRMGVYYLTHGAMFRPPEVLYDRANSVFALMQPDVVDWDALLADARFLHMSGITPALGPNSAREALRAARAADRLGIPLSMDGNYRAKLWDAWDGDSAAILHELFALAYIAFADARDIALVLQRGFDGDRQDTLRAAAAAAFDAFPKLHRIACTCRDHVSVDRQALSARMFTREADFTARTYELDHIVDRIGAGDAFVGGLLHALVRGRDDAAALEFALAAAVLKHSVPGDFNLVDADEIQALVAQEGLHVRR